jgi:hypothetical protein
MSDTIDTEIYVKNFLLYQNEMRRIGRPSRFADYDWYQLSENVSISWLAYNLMLPDFARGISNTINALGNYSQRLLAWHSTLQDILENERLAVVFEFVDPIAVLAANLPQVVRSRFIFAIAQLSHQANKVLDKVNWETIFRMTRTSNLNTQRSMRRDGMRFRVWKPPLIIYSQKHIN